jgi:hypothetical protein
MREISRRAGSGSWARERGWIVAWGGCGMEVARRYIWGKASEGMIALRVGSF